MKKYTITVNGTPYEVLVQEETSPEVSTAPAAAPAAAPVAPAPAPTPTPVAAPAGTHGAIQVVAPMPGTILKMNGKVGDTLEPNGLVCILEAMKMENEIFSEKGGVVASIDAPAGTSVQTGDVIITLN